MGSGEWLATPALREGKARSERRVVESDLSHSKTTAGGGGGHKQSVGVTSLNFWQSSSFKMAYHSPYKAPPHINAPPDQGFLWNIFQRWVRGGRLISP